jgi:hypothetical protein
VARNGSGETPLKKKLCLGKHVTYLEKRVTYLSGFSTHGFLPMFFLFSVKELGLWTNPGHWVRVLDVVGSYMYIVL